MEVIGRDGVVLKHPAVAGDQPRRVHELRSHVGYFGAVCSGQKRFEVRENDRGYHTGDLLWLREWDPNCDLGTYTGESCVCLVDYVMGGGQFGVAQGYVVLSIRLLHGDPDRIASPQTWIDLQRAIAAGRAKFPGRRFMLASLIEEVGELADALQGAGDTSSTDHRAAAEVRKEAIQVAGIAIRIAEEGDGSYDSPGNHRLATIMGTLGNLARCFLQKKPPHMVATGSRMLVKDVLELWGNQVRDPEFDDIQPHEALP